MEEDDGDLALAAELDEMRSFERGLREKNTVIGDDANWVPIEMAEARDERIAVVLLELVESAAIEDS